jgi:hypothetical protein
MNFRIKYKIILTPRSAFLVTYLVTPIDPIVLLPFFLDPWVILIPFPFFESLLLPAVMKPIMDGHVWDLDADTTSDDYVKFVSFLTVIYYSV